MLFDLLLTIGLACGLFMAALMVLSPRRLFEFGKRAGRLMGLPESDVAWHGGATWSWRIAGSFVACFFLLMVIFNSIHLVQRFRSVRMSIHGLLNDWYVPVSVLLMLALGIFTEIQAPAMFSWMQARSRIVPSQGATRKVGIVMFRLVGAIFIFGALITLGRLLTEIP